MPQVVPTTTELVPATDLIPHPHNYNHGDIDAVRESIRVNGFYGKIVRQASTGYTIAGHTRAAAAIAEGITLLPVDTIDVDDATALRILANDNRSAEKATRDQAALVDLLELVGVEAGDLVGSGYDADDLADLTAALEAATYTPPGTTEQQPDRLAGDGSNRQVFQEDAERIDASRRILVIDLPVQRFAWLVESLTTICARERLDTNTEAILTLVGRAVDDTPPPDA